MRATVDLPNLLTAYYALKPEIGVASQAVAFGTSGHRGSSLLSSFNEVHVLAIAQALADYRKAQGIAGPLFLAKDSHALSAPAFVSALEVLIANDVHVVVEASGGFTPTPVISRAILVANAKTPIGQGRADGVLLTPSHNPPEDGGFKYNPPHGGPADGEATTWIERRANALIAGGLGEVKRVTYAAAKRSALLSTRDFVGDYVADLGSVLDMAAIAGSGLKLGIDPLGGAATDYWAAIIDRYKLNADLVNARIDPTFAFMPPDWDGKIRMDCSSPHAMAGLLALKDRYDLAFANDTDADRHGIVSGAAGLMNPNHFLAVSIDYLFRHRPSWPANAAIGKTAVSSAIIDRVAADLGRRLVETPVGFKWFVEGLGRGEFGFAGEESAGATMLRRDGSVWTTDKDGLILCLLAAEMTAINGHDPASAYGNLTARLGNPVYARIDAPATAAHKAALKAMTRDTYPSSQLGGEPIDAIETHASGNGASLGGIKVKAPNGWFAARPSGTEDVYKIYAESFINSDHLQRLQADAQAALSRVFGAAI
jgi:phosphoglucomutase